MGRGSVYVYVGSEALLSGARGRCGASYLCGGGIRMGGQCVVRVKC